MRIFRGLNLDQAEIDFIRTNGDCDFGIGSSLSKPTINHHDQPVQDVID